MKNVLKGKGKLILLSVFVILLSQTLLASGSDLPWEGPLDKILKSLTGPVAKTVAILAVVGVGGMMAFGEMGSAIKKLLSVVLGIALIFAAASWVPTFFGFTGSALF